MPSMTTEQARGIGRDVGRELAGKAPSPWVLDWHSDAALEHPRGVEVYAVIKEMEKRGEEGFTVLEAFRDGWSDGLAERLAERRGTHRLVTGIDAGGVRFYVAGQPVRTGGALTMALADGSKLRGRLETHDGKPLFFFNVAGTTGAVDASFPIEKCHQFFTTERPA